METETDAMKQLKKLYAQNHTIEEDVAYIFVCPKAKYDGAEVKGDMPRSGQTGYVFSTAEKYDDGWTVAHELGHGLYSLQHTFKKESAKGTTNNLMDYNDGSNLKVWQWNLLYSHKDFITPFLESDEDGMANALTQQQGSMDYIYIKSLPESSLNTNYDGYLAFVNQAGNTIFVPSSAYNLYFWGGALIGFSLKDENGKESRWSSYYYKETKKHIGFYTTKPDNSTLDKSYEKTINKKNKIEQVNFAYLDIQEGDNDCEYYWGIANYKSNPTVQENITSINNLPIIDDTKIL